MNAVEIEEAISNLAAAPFEPDEFAFAFLQSFGNKPTTLKRLRKDTTNTGAEIETAAATPTPQQVAYYGMPPAEPEPEIFEIDWLSYGQKIRVQVKCTRNKFCNFDHLEIQSITPERHPLPITETGYKSHFLAHGEIDAFGDNLRVI